MWQIPPRAPSRQEPVRKPPETTQRLIKQFVQVLESRLTTDALAVGHTPASAGTKTPSGPPRRSCDVPVRGCPTSACNRAITKMKQTAAAVGFMTRLRFLVGSSEPRHRQA